MGFCYLNEDGLEKWKTDQTEDVAGCTNWCTAHLWIVPAKVEGTRTGRAGTQAELMGTKGKSHENRAD